MAGAIALDLREKGEENVFAIALLCCNRSCIRILHFSFVCLSRITWVV